MDALSPASRKSIGQPSPSEGFQSSSPKADQTQGGVMGAGAHHIGNRLAKAAHIAAAVGAQFGATVGLGGILTPNREGHRQLSGSRTPADSELAKRVATARKQGDVAAFKVLLTGVDSDANLSITRDEEGIIQPKAVGLATRLGIERGKGGSRRAREAFTEMLTAAWQANDQQLLNLLTHKWGKAVMAHNRDLQLQHQIFTEALQAPPDDKGPYSYAKAFEIVDQHPSEFTIGIVNGMPVVERRQSIITQSRADQWTFFKLLASAEENNDVVLFNALNKSNWAQRLMQQTPALKQSYEKALEASTSPEGATQRQWPTDPYRKMLDEVQGSEGTKTIRLVDGQITVAESGKNPAYRGSSRAAKAAFEMMWTKAVEGSDAVVIRSLLSGNWGKAVLKHHPDLMKMIEASASKLLFASPTFALIPKQIPDVETEYAAIIKKRVEDRVAQNNIGSFTANMSENFKLLWEKSAEKPGEQADARLPRDLMERHGSGTGALVSYNSEIQRFVNRAYEDFRHLPLDVQITIARGQGLSINEEVEKKINAGDSKELEKIQVSLAKKMRESIQGELATMSPGERQKRLQEVENRAAVINIATIADEIKRLGPEKQKRFEGILQRVGDGDQNIHSQLRDIFPRLNPDLRRIVYRLVIRQQAVAGREVQNVLEREITGALDNDELHQKYNEEMQKRLATIGTLREVSAQNDSSAIMKEELKQLWSQFHALSKDKAGSERRGQLTTEINGLTAKIKAEEEGLTIELDRLKSEADLARDKERLRLEQSGVTQTNAIKRKMLEQFQMRTVLFQYLSWGADARRRIEKTGLGDMAVSIMTADLGNVSLPAKEKDPEVSNAAYTAVHAATKGRQRSS